MSSFEEFNLIDLDDESNDTTGNCDSNSSENSEELNLISFEGDFNDIILNNGLNPDVGTHQQGNTSNILDTENFCSDNEDRENANNEKNWSELPSYIVEHIYTFLGRTDQSNMSQVCSRWAQDFESPSVWKNMTFILNGRDYFSEIFPEVKFARKYGYMFRHIKIVGTKVKPHLIGVMWVQLKLFLRAMTCYSQLNSIKFINIGDCFFHINDILTDLFQTLYTFFNSQEYLRTVTFRDGYFSKTEGSEILKAILNTNTNSIKNLKFRGFVFDSPFAIAREQYSANLSEMCDKITKVQSLEMNYSEMFEDLISCLHEKLIKRNFKIDNDKPGISALDIYCENYGISEFRGIPSNTWDNLAKAFPRMKVKMYVPVYCHLFSEVEQFLVKNIPLETLEIRFEKFSTTLFFDIEYLFGHVQNCLYQNHLKILNILWIPSNANLDAVVIPFVQKCKKLQTFFVFVDQPPTGIENILETLFKNHPKSLNFIRISFRSFENTNNEDSLRALSEKYFLLFNAQGIKCFVDVYPTVDSVQV